MNLKKKQGYNALPVLSAGEFVEGKTCLRFTPKDTLYDIVNTMREHHNFAALIIENSKLAGLITEHGILLYLLSWLTAPVQSMERATKAFNVLMAGDAMIRYPKTISAEMDIEDVFEKMVEYGFRYMPVVEDDTPVGIINRNDLTSFMEERGRKELESKDMMLSYLMHHENYGCV